MQEIPNTVRVEVLTSALRIRPDTRDRWHDTTRGQELARERALELLKAERRGARALLIHTSGAILAQITKEPR